MNFLTLLQSWPQKSFSFSGGSAKYTLIFPTRRRNTPCFRPDVLKNIDWLLQTAIIFRRSPRVASPRNFARACVFLPTIAIAKIRDHSQSRLSWQFLTVNLRNYCHILISKHFFAVRDKSPTISFFLSSQIP